MKSKIINTICTIIQPRSDRRNCNTGSKYIFFVSNENHSCCITTITPTPDSDSSRVYEAEHLRQFSVSRIFFQYLFIFKSASFFYFFFLFLSLIYYLLPSVAASKGNSYPIKLYIFLCYQ